MKNEIKPWLVKEWCIPKADAEFAAKMEDVLEIYQRPYDLLRPVVCIDETNKQLIEETRIPCEPGQLEKVDSVYVRNGVADIFMISAPLAGRRETVVTQTRTALDSRRTISIPLVAEWLGHTKMDTTRQFYANADNRPMQEAEQLVIDAINVGLAAMHKAPEEELKESLLGFIQKYGFLGFMTALPTTADFITYESVYLPKNHFIKAETLSTEEYLSYFYPFDKPDFRKKGVESGWSVTDREGIAITMAIGNAPQAVTMELQKEYAERYDRFIRESTDWAFTFMTSFLYYMDYDTIDEQTRDLYRQGISAFGGISPTYRIALEKDSPIIVWDFHSLLVMVQMCFSFMLTDKDSDMRMCKHCKKAFVASRKGNEFYSPQCKNQFNVYKSRKRGTIKMIENRNVNIITDADGKKLVLINDIRFKGKRQLDWNDVKQYLRDMSGTITKSLKMQSVFLLEANCLKNTRNQRAEKALWVQMQKLRQMPLPQYRS